MDGQGGRKQRQSENWKLTDKGYKGVKGRGRIEWAVSKWMRKGRKVEREREERLPWKDKVEEEEARK